MDFKINNKITKGIILSIYIDFKMYATKEITSFNNKKYSAFA